MSLPIGIGDRTITTTVLVGDGMAPLTAGNMGHVFLQNFVVTFDWSAGKMYLDPLAEDGSIEPFADSPGAAVGLQDGKIIVTSLALGGPADQAGLKLGEVVTAIDGKDVSTISPEAYCQIADADKSELTTANGKRYDISKIKGFFAPEASP